MQVQIIDDRPRWMVDEDGQHYCRFVCGQRRFCVTKCGAKCKLQGGEVIPKIRDGRWRFR